MDENTKFRISELQKEIGAITTKIEDLKCEREKKFRELNAIYDEEVCPICGKLHPNHGE